MTGRVHADLNEGGDKIFIRWDFDPTLLALTKRIPGVRFKPIGKDPEPDAAFWYTKATVNNAKFMHDEFGEELVMSTAMKKWIKTDLREGKKLQSLSAGDDAELTIVPKLLPELAARIRGEEVTTLTGRLLPATGQDRTYQRADIKFMAECPNPINANEPGAGKTIEAIGAVAEAGLLDGPNLVIAPLSALDVVWGQELADWQPHRVLVVPDGRENRIAWMQEALATFEDGDPFWLVVNPAMLTYRTDFHMCSFHSAEKPRKGKKWLKADLRRCNDCEEISGSDFPEFYEIEWNTVIMDEFHRAGLAEPGTLTAKAVNDLPAKKKIALSGTPIGGKPIKLYGVLHWLYPKEFSSKWAFADNWLIVSQNTAGYRDVGGVHPKRKDDFYAMLGKYMVRRTKAEIAPWLPPKQYVEIYVEMTPEQKKQYAQFEAETEIRIDEYDISAVGILAEYARLKQFSNAVQEVEVRPRPDPDEPPELILHPTEDSPKLPHIERLLEERGITPDEDAGGNEQVVIFSESKRMINMVHKWMVKKGYPAAKITGDVSRAERTSLVREFQAGTKRIMLMTTTAGGVAITLDQASTAIFLDETWNPDDQVQAEDRIHRASKIHQVTVYYIRTKATIQQYIQERVMDKSAINREILDLRRSRVLTGSSTPSSERT